MFEAVLLHLRAKAEPRSSAEAPSRGHLDTVAMERLTAPLWGVLQLAPPNSAFLGVPLHSDCHFHPPGLQQDLGGTQQGGRELLLDPSQNQCAANRMCLEIGQVWVCRAGDRTWEQSQC